MAKMHGYCVAVAFLDSYRIVPMLSSFFSVMAGKPFLYHMINQIPQPFPRMVFNFPFLINLS